VRLLAAVTPLQPAGRHAVTDPIPKGDSLTVRAVWKSGKHGSAKQGSSFDTFGMFLLCFTPDTACPVRMQKDKEVNDA